MATEAQGSWHPDPFGGGSWRWWDGAAWGSETAPASDDGDYVPIHSVVGGQLVLQRESAGTEGELMWGERLIARIGKAMFGSGGAVCSDGSWAFEGPPTNETKVVRVLPSRQEIGRFQWGDGGLVAIAGLNGSIAFVDGRRFLVRKTADVFGRSGGLFSDLATMAAADWTITSGWNQPLIRMQVGVAPSHGFFNVGAAEVVTDVYPDAGQVIEMPLLTLLGTFAAWGVAAASEARRRHWHRD
jgi:hypothetical protein